jgi:hypothetical protein
MTGKPYSGKPNVRFDEGELEIGHSHYASSLLYLLIAPNTSKTGRYSHCLCTATWNGYEVSVLPVPQEADGTYKTITGYGWTEDQSCFTNAAYIDTWHHVLAGQTKNTPSLSVDGYFTNYPENSTVLLYRTANGQPAFITYKYGLGQFFVITLYPDCGCLNYQSSAEELSLFRDLVTYAWEKFFYERIFFVKCGGKRPIDFPIKVMPKVS